MILQKQLFSFLIVFLFILPWTAGQDSEISLSFALTDCPDSVYLFQFEGIGYETKMATMPNEMGNGEFVLERRDPGFWYIGSSPKQSTPLILGDEGEVMVQGSCSNIKELVVVESDMNLAYANLKESISEVNKKSGRLFTILQRSKSQEERDQAIQDIKAVDQEKLALYEALRTDNAYLSKVLAINTYISYLSNMDKYDSEIEYFANEYFGLVDFSDPAFAQMPWVYDGVSRYGQTLISISISEELKKAYFDNLLAQMPEGTNTHKMALGGLISAAESRKSPLFSHFGNMFIEQYGSEYPQRVSMLAAKIKRANRLAVGSVAPDFAQSTPDGEEMKLSDLKGSYVLVDFWASWCGPCRRENPNVVRLYNKYKDSGFKIIGVSLDRDRTRWLDAIEKDGLTWHHVSDLKGWKNAVAQDYNISSIPRTLLLDPTGKIIAKDLRGPSLVSKLEQLFGDQ